MIVGLGTAYTVLAGLRGVVITDVFQGFIVFIIIALVANLAMKKTFPETFVVGFPLPDGAVGTRTVSKATWLQPLPAKNDFDSESPYAVYNEYWIAVLLYSVKCILEASSGGGGYIAQRFLAAGSDREVHHMTLLWIVLLSFRWMNACSFFWFWSFA